jgi:hypothetical protein
LSPDGWVAPLSRLWATGRPAGIFRDARPRCQPETALGWADNLSRVWWGVGVLAGSLTGGLLVLASARADRV